MVFLRLNNPDARVAQGFEATSQPLLLEGGMTMARRGKRRRGIEDEY